ncbi:MAG: 5-deoxy-glucuronate isomerase [Moorellaceae bacterium]
MGLHYRYPKDHGRLDLINEHEHGLVAFSLLKLREKETYRGNSGPYEIAIVLLGGVADVTVEGGEFRNLGARTDVFSGRATAVYIPRETNFSVEAPKGEVEAALCQVKADRKYAPFVVTPEEVTVSHRGNSLCEREIHDIIGNNGRGRVDKIILGETFSLPGNWSSFPPHKHDRYTPPEENELVEVYHFRILPDEGFGVQITYTEDGHQEEAYVVRNGDTVLIPSGYHPVAAPPGVKLYYLWFLAGTYGREVLAATDPVFQKLCGI